MVIDLPYSIYVRFLDLPAMLTNLKNVGQENCPTEASITSFCPTVLVRGVLSLVT